MEKILHFEKIHPILEIKDFITKESAQEIITLLETNRDNDECWGAICFREYWKRQRPEEAERQPVYTSGTDENTLSNLNLRIRAEAEIFLNGMPPKIEFSKFKGHRHGEGAYTPKHGFDPGEVVAILVLNEDFEGGEIFIDNPEIEFSPNARSLYLFREGAKIEHGVRKITSGIRMSLVSHWQKLGHVYNHAGANN